MSGYLGQAPGQGQIQYFTFTATAGQTTFTGIDDNKYVLNYDIGFCDVFLNGRRLTPNSDYTATNGSTVVLQSAASLNDVIFIASASTFSTANWVTNAVNYVYIATAGQTTFTGGDSNGNSLSYVNGTILVSVNGINLPQSDFTASNGSTVILNSGVNAGDIVQIFSLRTMAVSNFLPLTGGAISGSLTVGNSTVNTYITAGNIALNGSTLLIGNSTSNVVITGTTLTISNSTSNASFGTGPAAINAIATNTFTVGSTMYVVSNGNVGIGSSTPSATLDVVSNNNFGQLFLYKTSGGSDNYVRLNLQNSTGADYFQIAANPNSNASLSLMNFYTSGSGGNILSLSGNGNVGVGTSSPVYKVHVYGSGDPIIGVSSNTSGQAGQFNAIGNGATSYPGFNLYQNSTNYWSFQMRGDTNCYINRQSGSGNVSIPSGNFGIGTNSPGARLTVGDGGEYGANAGTGQICLQGAGNIITVPGKPCLYHRAGVGLGVYSDYQMSVEVNGSSSKLEAMRVTHTGVVTTPKQPVFVVSFTGSSSLSFTSGQKFTFNAVKTDIGSNFSTTNNRYTAPVSGSYKMTASFHINTNPVYCRPVYRVNGTDYFLTSDQAQSIMSVTGTELTMILDCILVLNAGDYVEIFSRAGSGTTQFYTGHSWWSGYLIG